MRNFLILMVFLSSAPLAPANAQGKVGPWVGWYPSNTEWNYFTKYNPYLENGQHPHPEQFRQDSWTPDIWIQQRRNGVELVRGFYTADIIRDQSVEDDVPVITVGPAFYRLGGLDKRRVIASIDRVYGITAQNAGGAILLRDWHTRLQVGAYTQQGLMIQ